MQAKLKIFNITVLVIVIGSSAIARLIGLSENGLNGTDIFVYWEIAKKWNAGNFVFNSDPWGASIYFFRPIFYLLNLLSIKIFGVHDYSLKLMMGIWETFSILLIYLIGRALRGNFLGICLVIVYGTTPASLIWTQTELAHTYVNTFLLSSFLLILKGYLLPVQNSRTISYRFLTLSGVSCGCAALTHGSAGMFSLGFILALFIFSPILHLERNRTHLITTTKSILTFGGSFFLCYFISGLIFGFDFTFHALISETSMHRLPSDPWKDLLSVYQGGFVENSSSFFAALTLLLTTVSLIRLAFNIRLDAKFFPLIIILSYLILFTIVFRGGTNGRFYLSVIPFTVIFTLLSVDTLIQNTKLRYILLGVLSLALGYSNLEWRLGTYLELARGFRGAPRQLYETVNGKLSKNSKVLIAPSLVRNWPKRFDAWPYIKSRHLVYLFDCKETSFPQFLSENKIRYILVTKEEFQSPSMLNFSSELVGHLGSCFGWRKDHYSVEDELKKIEEFLTKNQAIVMDFPKNYGTLYELSKSGS